MTRLNTAERRLRQVLVDAIDAALNDESLCDGTLGYINDMHVGLMAEAALREIHHTRLHEEWMTREAVAPPPTKPKRKKVRA